MADLWRVTYMGDGVKSTPVGAFAKYTTAFVAEDFAKSVQGESDWIVADPTGHEHGSKAAPAAKKPEEKKPEKHEEKKPEKAEKHDEKKPEKHDEKKAEKKEEKKPEKAPEKKPVEAEQEQE